MVKFILGIIKEFISTHLVSILINYGKTLMLAGGILNKNQ